MDKKKVNAAVEFFTRNPYWKKMYEEAPSDKCRERIALTFYYSTFFDEANADGTWVEAMKSAEDELKLEDWKYLLKYQGNNPGKLMIRKRIEELEEHRIKDTHPSETSGGSKLILNYKWSFFND